MRLEDLTRVEDGETLATTALLHVGGSERWEVCPGDMTRYEVLRLGPAAALAVVGHWSNREGVLCIRDSNGALDCQTLGKPSLYTLAVCSYFAALALGECPAEPRELTERRRYVPTAAEAANAP